ncbi:hypothetical protein KQX54_020301 [Cotesia glomerata]|uniref:Secreted protein n=1 Tax=Cotesia glomerata TaxID=32391 RepID=A0AAV7J8A1_COTGL|nr:hypothetical protein KQX54_020301 [Cotesia glomerata]
MLWMIALALCLEMSTLVSAIARRTTSPTRSPDDYNLANDELDHPKFFKINSFFFEFTTFFSTTAAQMPKLVLSRMQIGHSFVILRFAYKRGISFSTHQITL